MPGTPGHGLTGLSIVEKWLCGMERGKMTTAFFMDFDKAFDKEWHRDLIYKLTTAGASLLSVSRLSDYLSRAFLLG